MSLTRLIFCGGRAEVQSIKFVEAGTPSSDNLFILSDTDQ